MQKYTFPDRFQAYQLQSYLFMNELGTLVEFIVKFVASQLAVFAAIYDFTPYPEIFNNSFTFTAFLPFMVGFAKK